MYSDDEDDYWKNNGPRAFNFEDEEQQLHLQHQQQQLYHHQPHHDQQQPSHPQAAPATRNDKSSSTTLEQVLATKPASSQPFLAPSMVLCDGTDIERLIEYLDERNPELEQRQDPRSYILEIVDRKRRINFSAFKSRRDKLVLLDCALAYNDGNLITAVSIFLGQTLKKSIFDEEMRKRPEALNHYKSYLELTGGGPASR